MNYLEALSAQEARELTMATAYNEVKLSLDGVVAFPFIQNKKDALPSMLWAVVEPALQAIVQKNPASNDAMAARCLQGLFYVSLARDEHLAYHKTILVVGAPLQKAINAQELAEFVEVFRLTPTAIRATAFDDSIKEGLVTYQRTIHAIILQLLTVMRMDPALLQDDPLKYGLACVKHYPDNGTDIHLRSWVVRVSSLIQTNSQAVNAVNDGVPAAVNVVNNDAAAQPPVIQPAAQPPVVQPMNEMKSNILPNPFTHPLTGATVSSGYQQVPLNGLSQAAFAYSDLFKTEIFKKTDESSDKLMFMSRLMSKHDRQLADINEKLLKQGKGGVNMELIQQRIKLKQMLLDIESKEVGCGFFTKAKVHAAHATAYELIINGSCLPNLMAVHLTIRDSIKWSKITQSPQFTGRDLYNKTDHIATWWQAAYLYCRKILMELVLNCSCLVIVKDAKVALQRFEEMNTWILRSVINKVPSLNAKSAWTRVIVAFHLNALRLRQGHDRLSFESLEFAHIYSLTSEEGIEATPALHHLKATTRASQSNLNRKSDPMAAHTETRTCHYCNREGHLQHNCYRKKKDVADRRREKQFSDPQGQNFDFDMNKENDSGRANKRFERSFNAERSTRNTNNKKGIQKKYKRRNGKLYGEASMIKKVCNKWERSKCFYGSACWFHHMCKRCGLVNGHVTSKCDDEKRH
eukprot:170637_1